MTVIAALRRFAPLLRPDLRSLAIAAVLLTISAGCEIAAVFFLSDVIDGALTSDSMQSFALSAAVWLVITVVAAGADYTGLLTAVGTSERFVLRLRNQLYAHVQRLNPLIHRRYGLGDMVTRHSSDIEAVEHMTGSGLLQLGVALLHVIGLLVVGFVLSWQVSLVAVIAIPVLSALSALFSRAQTRAARDERAATSAIGVAVHEGLAGIETTVAYNQQKREHDLVDRHGRSWMRARLAQTRVEAGFGSVLSVGQILTMLAIAVVGAWQIRLGHLTVGELIALTGYLGYLYPKVQEIAELRLAVAAAVVSAERVAEILDITPSAADLDDARPLPSGRGTLELRGVGFKYDRPLITDATFTVRPGSITALVGPSGSGKSTLAALVARFDRPQCGVITLGGNDIGVHTAHSVREQITLLPQQVVIRAGTVAENIAYGTPGADEAAVVAAARDADADGFIRGLPDGYRTQLADGGLRLSGGQRQRIAIARAILRDAPVLVLDEPTAGLDDHSVDRIIGPLLRLAAGRATLLITHDTRLAALAHETVEMRADGRTRRRQRATMSTIISSTSTTTAATPIVAGEMGRVGAAGRSGDGGGVVAAAGAGAGVGAVGVGVGGVGSGTGPAAGRVAVGCTRAAGNPDSVRGDDRFDRVDDRPESPQIGIALSLRGRGDWSTAPTLPPGPAAMRAN
ncbi:hypothetical protein GCM10009619_01850 [Williamsia maris]|uniref:ATP-binding cassette, subfamily B n=1 Tax=Williamsia maris TaxID=72806 RepID=A0ABT1HBX5_9NOCA|nr:ATP-binding cassette, subfamily B [Williamsia maris]